MQDTTSDRPQRQRNGSAPRRLAMQLLPAGAAALLLAGCGATTGGTTRAQRDSDRQNDDMDDRNGSSSY